MRPTLPRLCLLLLLSACALLTTAPPASAHPTLVATLPEAGYGVTEPPEEIGLVFDEPVTVNTFVVEGRARGRVATTPVRISRDGKVIVRPLTPPPAGRYIVRWQITAEDGDVMDGAYGFGVGVAAAQMREESSTPGLGTAAVLRWALFAGLALSLGGLAGAALVRLAAPDAEPPEDRPDRRRSPPEVVAGCALGLAAALGLGLHQVGGGDLGGGLAAFTPARLTASSAGTVIAVEIVAFALATLAALARFRTPAILVLVVVVIAEGERSHLMATAGGVGGFTIAVHLAAVALWIGALFHVVRSAWRRRADPRRARAVFLVYAKFAVVVYAVVVVTGTGAAIMMLPTPEALVTSTYGWVLLGKLALVALATGLTLAARRRLRPPARTPTVLVRADAAVLVAVLAASGLLTALPPPSDTATGLPYPPPMTGPTVRLGLLTGQVTTGITAGQGRLEVRLRVPGWDPARDEGFAVRGTLIAPGEPRRDLDLEPCGNGCFAGQAGWRAGVNTVELTIATDRRGGGVARFTVPWPARPARDLFDRARTRLASERAVRFTETVTSDTRRPAGFSKRLRMTGAELLDKQPYRSGLVSAPVVLGRTAGETEIAFAIPAEGVHVRMTTDAEGRLLRELMTTPNHQITRTFHPAKG